MVVCDLKPFVWKHGIFIETTCENMCVKVGEELDVPRSQGTPMGNPYINIYKPYISLYSGYLWLITPQEFLLGVHPKCPLKKLDWENNSIHPSSPLALKSTHDITNGPLVMSLDPFVMRDTLKKHPGLNAHILSGQKNGNKSAVQRFDFFRVQKCFQISGQELGYSLRVLGCKLKHIFNVTMSFVRCTEKRGKCGPISKGVMVPLSQLSKPCLSSLYRGKLSLPRSFCNPVYVYVLLVQPSIYHIYIYLDTPTHTLLYI